jgi:type II secretion system protein N
MNLSDRHKRILTWVGYPLLALVVFVFVLHYTFPYERVKDRMIDALSDKYDVTIASVEPTFLPGGMILKTMALRTRPEKPDEDPTTIIIDEVRVDISLLALLGGAYDVDIEAAIGGGTIEGNVRLDGGGIETRVTTKGLPLHNIPGIRDAVGLPMEGGLDADIALDLPKGNWREADGHLRLACLGCTVGDGKTKIKPPSQGRRGGSRAIFAGDGVTVPKLDLGNFSADIAFNKGKGKVEHFAATSQDGELAIEGEILLASKLEDSTFPGCMRFRLTDDLKQRERDFGNVPALLGVTLTPEGFANLRMTGKVSSIRWRPARECNAGIGDDDGAGGLPRAAARPTITTSPGDQENERPTLRTAAPAEPEPEPEQPPPSAAAAPPPEVTGPNTSGPELSNEARAVVRRGRDDVSIDRGDEGEDPAGGAVLPDDSARPPDDSEDPDGDYVDGEIEGDDYDDYDQGGQGDEPYDG